MIPQQARADLPPWGSRIVAPARPPAFRDRPNSSDRNRYLKHVKDFDIRYITGARAPDLPAPPERVMSRQAWQEDVQALIEHLRRVYRRPAFGLTEGEISVHYHRPLNDFIALLREKLS